MNLLSEMLRTAQSGGNPMTMLQQMGGADPRVGQFVQMFGGKSPRQMRQLCENMARERGVDLGGLARQLGIRM